ncbi:MAG: DUF222 domain-containing protein [Microbacterium sp.]
MNTPPELPAEVEAALWAERSVRAEAWAEPSHAAVDAMVVPLPVLESDVLHREQLVSEWEHAVAQVARWEAVKQRVLAESLDYALLDGTQGVTPDLRVRSMAAELAWAAGMSDRTIAAHMADAADLRDRFAATLDRVAAGRLSRPHAQVVADEGRGIDDAAARAEYERLMLDLTAEGLTTGRLRAAAKAIAEQLVPTRVSERHRVARERRRVDVRELADGMAVVAAEVPAALAFGIHDRLTQQARIVRDAERAATLDAEAEGGPAPVARSLDQIRADLFCDLLLTGHPTAESADAHGGDGLGAVRGIVQVTVPVLTLLGEESREPAMLAGRCPIDPETARRIAGAATLWERVLTDPVTGDVLATDRRFPTAAQQRHLRARDEHCRAPGCRLPVWRCDVDHTIDHAKGGKTTRCNLAHLCRRHHTLKHHTAWTVAQRDGGVLVWTSPTGRVYTDRPPPTLRFIPADGRAPSGHLVTLGA